MCTVSLCRDSISQLSAGHATCGRTKGLSINRKVNSLCYIAIRSVAERHFTIINQRIIKRALQVELNDINCPCFCTNTANAISYLQLDGIITAVQILSYIKAVFTLNNGLRTNLCVANIPDASCRAGIITRVIHRRELEIDDSRVASNNGQRRTVKTLDLNDAGTAASAAATASALNNDLRFYGSIFQ